MTCAYVKLLHSSYISQNVSQKLLQQLKRLDKIYRIKHIVCILNLLKSILNSEQIDEF